MNPDVILYQEDRRGHLSSWRPEHTDTQQYLWHDCYLPDIARVIEIADGDPIIVNHIGDLTQGKKYQDQLVSTRTADQLLIAKKNLEPWLELPNVIRLNLVVGTRSHIFSEATSPLLVRDMLQPSYPEIPIEVIYHTRPTINGCVFDAAHHGPSSGIREWTQGNQLRYYLKSLVFHDILRAKHPPHLVIRGHFHKYWPEKVTVKVSEVLLAFLHQLHHADHWPPAESDADVFAPLHALDPDNIITFESHIVLLPAYCGLGEYGRQATGSSPTISTGMVATEIRDGRIYKNHRLERELDIRRSEVIL
jgi:hypothetical protein